VQWLNQTSGGEYAQKANGMLIFLDFDGVLHPFGCAPSHHFCELPRLVRVMREWRFQHFEIVVTSSWRLAESFDNGVLSFSVLPLDPMQEHFPADLRSRIVGVTPCLGELAEGSREKEIWQWLSERNQLDRQWLALDDFADLFKPACPNLLLVQGRVGLSDATESELRRRLR
jgi:hypothetical protein